MVIKTKSIALIGAVMFLTQAFSADSHHSREDDLEIVVSLRKGNTQISKTYNKKHEAVLTVTSEDETENLQSKQLISHIGKVDRIVMKILAQQTGECYEDGLEEKEIVKKNVITDDSQQHEQADVVAKSSKNCKHWYILGGTIAIGTAAIAALSFLSPGTSKSNLFSYR